MGVILTPQHLVSLFTPEKEFFELLFGVKVTPQKITPL